MSLLFGVDIDVVSPSLLHGIKNRGTESAGIGFLDLLLLNLARGVQLVVADPLVVVLKLLGAEGALERPGLRRGERRAEHVGPE